jgi:hypothetical protein
MREHRGYARSFSTTSDRGLTVPIVLVEHDGSGERIWLAQRFVSPVERTRRARWADVLHRTAARYMS